MREIPDEVRRAAAERAQARAARDWTTADRLRAEIEAAGWRVVDAGTDYRLERAYVEDVVGEVIRYGRSESVPSRLAEPDATPATVVIVATGDATDAVRATDSVRSRVPAASIVVVADGLEDEDALAALPDAGVEVVRTAARLGHGAAVQIGIRRASGRVVVLMDPSVELTGDAITPLVGALEDPRVAVAGAFGLVSEDLRHFDEVDDGEAAAIEGYLMAFRRSDAAARGPVDEHFRFYRNFDIWWSLVLRDETDGEPRRAVVVPGLPLVRHEHRGWTSLAEAERDRLSKRNFYRVLDRFGQRPDLAVRNVSG